MNIQLPYASSLSCNSSFHHTILETNLLKTEVRMEARLLTCVNMRRDPTKPFQSIKSLVEMENITGTNKSKKNRMDTNNSVANGGTCTTIWKSSVTLKSLLAVNHVDFEVPILIDPSARASCLTAWPHATALPHDTDKRILNFTTDGPLFQYKVVLLVSVFRGKQSPSFNSCIP